MSSQQLKNLEFRTFLLHVPKESLWSSVQCVLFEGVQHLISSDMTARDLPKLVTFPIQYRYTLELLKTMIQPKLLHLNVSTLYCNCFHNKKVLLKLYYLGVICFQTCILNFSVWLPTEKSPFTGNYHTVVPKTPCRYCSLWLQGLAAVPTQCLRVWVFQWGPGAHPLCYSILLYFSGFRYGMKNGQWWFENLLTIAALAQKPVL